VLTREASPTSSRTTPRSSRPRTRRPASKKADPVLAALPPARRGAPAAGRRRGHGAGQRYLIQHSAGSGKSNSIAWLAHQLIGLERDETRVFDSIIVVTDRRILDRQIRDTIKQFAQVSSTVGHAERSGDLRRFVEGGKKIIISTVQKFPFILDEIGSEHRGRRFAIIIDEAHSSQGGRTSAKMPIRACGQSNGESLSDDEDRRGHHQPADGSAKKLLPNASYFAFTATPKNKTLEIFGEPDPRPTASRPAPRLPHLHHEAGDPGGLHPRRAGKHYTPVESYYRLIKTVEDDPEFDTKRAQKKLRRYVESHEHAIRLKAEIMVDHFHEKVAAAGKIGGQARAMVVTSGVERAIQYYHAIRDYLTERQEPLPGHRGLLGRARVWGREGHRVVVERLSVKPHHGQDPGRALPLPDLRRQVSDGIRRAAAAHHVRGQGAVGHQGRADAVQAEPGPSQEARRVRARLRQRHRHDPARIRRPYYRTTILAEETDPEQAARPEGAARRPPGLHRGAGRRPGGAVPPRRRPRPARRDPRRLRGRLPGDARRGRAGRFQGQGQGLHPNLRLPVGRSCPTATRAGRSSRSS
jgi:type I restriction enzyme R subunit